MFPLLFSNFSINAFTSITNESILWYKKYNHLNFYGSMQSISHYNYEMKDHSIGHDNWEIVTNKMHVQEKYDVLNSENKAEKSEEPKKSQNYL